MRKRTHVVAACLVVLIPGCGGAFAERAGGDLHGEVVAAMRKAAAYYRTKVASHGGYVYHYSVDLKQRWGEGVATPDQIWVQPPGTPTVGMAYLKAYEATGDRFYLDGAREAAEALVYGQLNTGGWSNSIDFRLRVQTGARYQGGKRRAEGTSSLDDGQTQSAIRLVTLADQALGFRHEEIHRSAQFALGALLAAQFPNGGFPQIWRTPIKKYPVLKASYPTYDWKTEGRIKNYWDLYTLNDNVCGYVAETLIDAHRVYGEEKYLTALRRLGDFLILAQMPDPQPGWAQQYNYDMKPVWARKFEPPGISGDESQEVLDTLMAISVATGDAKYLEPIPRALAYLRRSLLRDGRLARFYELKTNRPLYMERKSKKVYRLTYDDSRLPKHYGWKIQPRLADIEERYEALKAGRRREGVSARDLEIRAREILRSLDDEGRWISTYAGEPLVGQPKFRLNSPYIASAVFSGNLEALSEYLIAVRAK